MSEYEFASRLSRHVFDGASFERPRLSGWVIVLAMAAIVTGSALGFAI
jgi:hypothetical protein